MQAPIRPNSPQEYFEYNESISIELEINTLFSNILNNYEGGNTNFEHKIASVLTSAIDYFKEEYNQDVTVEDMYDNIEFDASHIDDINITVKIRNKNYDELKRQYNVNMADYQTALKAYNDFVKQQKVITNQSNYQKSQHYGKLMQRYGDVLYKLAIECKITCSEKQFRSSIPLMEQAVVIYNKLNPNNQI